MVWKIIEGTNIVQPKREGECQVLGMMQQKMTIHEKR